MRSRTIPLALFLASFLLGCDAGMPGSDRSPTIPDDVFVETMVELRRAAMQESDGRVPPSVRDEILRNRGLTRDDLLTFVDVHGANVPRMTGVWTRIEARLTGQDPDSLKLDETDLDTIPGLDPGDTPGEGPPSEAPPPDAG